MPLNLHYFSLMSSIIVNIIKSEIVRRGKDEENEEKDLEDQEKEEEDQDLYTILSSRYHHLN